jgi:hypothetical protein
MTAETVTATATASSASVAVAAKPAWLSYQWFASLSGLEWFAILCAAIFVGVMVRGHFRKESQIDLVDLLLEDTGKEDLAGDPIRRVTLPKFTGFAGFFLGAFAFLHSLLGGSLDKNGTAIMLFMGTCFAAQFVGKISQGDR